MKFIKETVNFGAISIPFQAINAHCAMHSVHTTKSGVCTAAIILSTYLVIFFFDFKCKYNILTIDTNMYIYIHIRDKWTRVVCASGSGIQKIDTSDLSIATIVFVKEHRVLRTGSAL